MFEFNVKYLKSVYLELPGNEFFGRLGNSDFSETGFDSDSPNVCHADKFIISRV